MNPNNKNNQGIDADDYENMAVQKSNVAKRIAAGAGVLLGGAALSGGAAYAATHNVGEAPAEADADDINSGADVGSTVGAASEQESQTQSQPTAHVSHASEPAHDQPAPEPSEDDSTNVTWDETTNVYVDGDKIGSVESGTVDGHGFAIVDSDGDNYADRMYVDVNDNGQFEDDEYQDLSVADNVQMGHATAHTTDQYLAYNDVATPDSEDGQEEMQEIHNDFEDEKTGEEYHGDYAENNTDYNPDADVEGYSDPYAEEQEQQYYAENDANELLDDLGGDEGLV